MKWKVLLRKLRKFCDKSVFITHNFPIPGGVKSLLYGTVPLWACITQMNRKFSVSFHS